MKLIDKSVYTFSKDNAPFCNVDTGELLVFKTMDCFSGQITTDADLMHTLDLSKANPAAGPVYVNGAEVGDVLVCDILDVQVDSQGCACSMGGTGQLSGESEVRTRVVPVKDGKATFNGVSWYVNPMIGVIGTAPKEGAVPCGFCGDHGGNMDSNVIVKGVRLYFPVRVAGALFQLGDLHASMGDGEVCGTGLEIAGEVTVKLGLIKGFELNWPVTETLDNWYVNTTASSFDDASIAACREMSRLIEPVYGWDTTDTFLYLSMQGDLGINQTARPAHDDMYTLRLRIPKVAEKAPLIG